jgi:quercetin dioxygenase-like cupin family protein
VDEIFVHKLWNGAIRSQINDCPEKVYHAGENFAEVPGDHHNVSKNDSDTQPASLLAVLVVDTNEKNLTTIKSETQNRPLEKERSYQS